MKSYELVKNYEYTDADVELENKLLEYQNEGKDITYFDVFNNEAFANYICQQLDISVNSIIFIEDFKLLNEINIEDAQVLVDSYANELKEDLINSDLIDEDEDINDYIVELSFDTINGMEFCTEIEKLIIKNANISELNDDIKYLSKLKEIDLSKNSITSVSENIANITSLESINLSSNYLESTGNIITNLDSLHTLNLSNNPTIKYVSKDIYDKYTNGNLRNIVMDSDVKYIDGDLEEVDYLYNTNVFNQINIEDRFIVKSYLEDQNLNYYDFLIPNFSKEIIKDLNEKEVSYGNIKVHKLHDNFTYNENEFKLEMIDELLLTKSNDNLVYEGNDRFENSIFNEKGIYFIEVSVNHGNITIKQEIAFVVFDILADEVIEMMDEEIENQDSDTSITETSIGNVEIEESNLDIHDEEDIVISQSEQIELEEEAVAMEQYDELVNSVDFEEISSFAGVYLDDENEVVIQLAEDTKGKKPKGHSKKVRDKVKKESHLKIEEVKFSYDQLVKYSQKIAKKIGDQQMFTIKVDEENNGLIISATNEDMSIVNRKVSSLKYTKKINIEYVIDDSIKDNETHKATGVRMASTFYVNLSDGWVDRASFGYRAKRQVQTTVKKNGKKVKKKVWVKGATIPNHMDQKVGKKVYKYYPVKCSNGKKDCVKTQFYVGKIDKRSKSSDTDFVRFSSSYAYPEKKLRKSTGYTSVTNSSKYMVKGAKVWKMYKSVYTDAKWVSGTIDATSVSTGTFSNGNSWDDTIGVTISSTGGDSGSPLVRYYGKYKSGTYKKYILGTTIGGSGNTRYFAKVENSINKLKIVPY